VLKDEDGSLAQEMVVLTWLRQQHASHPIKQARFHLLQFFRTPFVHPQCC
jgi:hypothetical protein